MTQKIMVIDLETFRSGNQVEIQQKQVLLEALADKSKVISNIEIKGNNLLITYSDDTGDTCKGSLCGDINVNSSEQGFSLSFKGDIASTAQGQGSFASGKGCNAKGFYSVAMGSGCTSQGKFSTAIGRLCKAGGFSSVALGYGCNTMDDISVKGVKTSANYEGISMGYECYVGSGKGSVAMGNQCYVLKGSGAVAMGLLCKASKDYSVAMGTNNSANGEASFAVGNNCIANGVSSVSMGSNNTTYNKGEFACGFYNKNAFNGYKGTYNYGIEQYFSVGHGAIGNNNNLFSIGTNNHNTYMQLYMNNSSKVFEPSLKGDTLVWTQIKGSS